MPKKVLGPADNPKPFVKGHKSMGGRPPKVTTAILKEWKDAGYERVSAAQVQEVYEHLIGMSRAELKKLSEDMSQPSLITIAASRMLTSSRGFEAIETMVTRAHGASLQRAEIDLTNHDVKHPSALNSALASLGFTRAADPGDKGRK